MGHLKSIIVIGASAGGLKAITELISAVRLNFDVAVFVVLHVSKNSSGQILVNLLQKATDYQCGLPDDGEVIKGGHLYIARPDYHMIVKKGIIRVIKGPHENRWRPSIDVLFRSAAVAYCGRVI